MGQFGQSFVFCAAWMLSFPPALTLPVLLSGSGHCPLAEPFLLPRVGIQRTAGAGQGRTFSVSSSARGDLCLERGKDGEPSGQETPWEWLQGCPLPSHTGTGTNRGAQPWAVSSWRDHWPCGNIPQSTSLASDGLVSSASEPAEIWLSLRDEFNFDFCKLN